MKRKTHSMDVEMIKAAINSIGDTLERVRDIEENVLSKWVYDDVIYYKME